MFSRIREDIRTVLSGDPAARNWLEVVLFYPGLHALWSHRVAHLLWRRRLRLFARFVSYLSRFLTGIEIHPAAGIGRRFFIDHGAGVVIGETAEIGNDVLIYQGVVLGGTTLEKKKRHPTICDKVVIGASAIVLGPIVVGEGARIGANSVVVRPVPAGAVVVGVPGRIVEDRKEPVLDLQHGKLPDPFSEAIRLILEEQLRLSRRIAKLEEARGLTPVPDDIAEKLKWIEKAFNNISNSDGSDK